MTKIPCRICGLMKAHTARNFAPGSKVCRTCERYENRDGHYKRVPEDAVVLVTSEQQRIIDKLNFAFQEQRARRLRAFREQELAYWRDHQEQLCVVLGIAYAPCTFAASEVREGAIS